MLSKKIRRAFLRYFEKKGHAIIPSSPVYPHDDPTLLFINAGMNQFKDVFLGKSKREYTRAATTQKCVRVGGKHNDLDNVGHTSRHLTLFEMLGNFSFGDYFKKEAISFAWEVSCQVFELDPDKIWISVFETDEEAYSLWKSHVPEKRIVRFGEKENFWSMGEIGPCGPCSELLYDKGKAYGDAKTPLEDPSGERFLEFWNLVFMQFEKNRSGKLSPLPKKSIDTGAGLERVVSLKMGVDDVFETDILRSLITRIEEVSGRPYRKEPAFHVIADHIRSLCFAIADGAQPSNTDRGYVLRKVLRRAVRYGKTLGLNEPFLARIFPELASSMGEDFPELINASDRIQEILTSEEEGFFRTLKRGGQLFSQVLERSKNKKKIAGEDAFKLKDTYGLPLEEIELLAKDENLSIDTKRFFELEKQAKELSKKAHKDKAGAFSENFFEDLSKKTSSEFVGYQTSSCKAKILAIVVGGEFREKIEAEEEGILILDKTPFYAEMGGQVGDTGRIGPFFVENTKSPYPNIIAHFGKMEMGSLEKGMVITAKIEEKRRLSIANNHSATHLLHFALRKILGEHVVQAGSLVEEKRLRFDFSHHKHLSLEELRAIERSVNEMIREDFPIETEEMLYREAKKSRDILQFFGDRYGEKVRVVGMGHSKELCGGTHTKSTGKIGLFKIVKEGSIAAGMRRIEAETGAFAEARVEAKEDLLTKVSSFLKSGEANLLEKLEMQKEEIDSLQKQIKSLKADLASSLIEELIEKKEKINTVSFIGEIVSLAPEDLSELASRLLSALKSGVVAIGSELEDRCQLYVVVSPELAKINAAEIVKEIGPLIHGGGGGRQNAAQAGGKNPKGLKPALDKIRQLLLHAT